MKPLASIRLGLPAAILLAVLCTSAALAVSTAFLAERHSARLANSYGESLAAQLADIATEAVIAGDLTSLAAITRRMADMAVVASARVESLDGRQLAASGPSDRQARAYLAELAFEDTVVGRARVELHTRALTLTGPGFWFGWLLLSAAAAALSVLAARWLGDRWAAPVEQLTRAHAELVGLPAGSEPDVAAAATLLASIEANPEHRAEPLPDTAVTVINLFNHQSLAAADAYKALERAAAAGEQVIALYGGHLRATRNGIVLGWHAADEHNAWNGICGALLLARLLDGPGGEFRIGIHLWRGADGQPAEVDAELVREAVALSSFAPSGQVAVSSAVMELMPDADERIRARAVAGTTWQALNRASREVWVLEDLAPRFAALLDGQVAQLDAAAATSLPAGA